MFRTWWQSLTNRVRTIRRPRGRARLWMARLEDRTAPAVVASLAGARLDVHLTAAGDVANLQVVGGSLRVTDVGGVVLDAPLQQVSHLSVIGELSLPGQAVNLLSGLSLIGSISVTDVGSIDLQGPLTAGRGIVLRSSSTLAIDAPVTCTDSVDITAAVITITQPIVAAAHPGRPYEVQLTATGGDVTQSTAGAITGDRLLINATAGSIDLPAANAVGSVTLGARQSVRFYSGRDLAVLGGVSSERSDVTLTVPADKSIKVAGGSSVRAGATASLSAGVIAVHFGAVLAGQYLDGATGQKVGDVLLSAATGDVVIAGDATVRTTGAAGQIAVAAAKTFCLDAAAGQAAGPRVDAPGGLGVEADGGLLLSGGVGGDVTIKADVVDINIPIVALNCVIIQPQTAGRPIYLGVDFDVTPQLRLSDAELDFIDAPFLLIGSPDSGPISVYGAIDLKVQASNGSGAPVTELQLLTPLDVQKLETGKLTVDRLAVQAGTGVGLSALNDVNVFSAASTAGFVDMYDVNDITSGTAELCDNNGKVIGVSSGDNDVRIRAVGDVVIVTPVDAPTGSVIVEAVGDVIVGRGGVVTAGQDVTLEAGAGGADRTVRMTLAVGDPLALPPKIDAGKAVALKAKTIDLAGGAGIDPLTVTLTADSMNINVIVSATDRVTLEPLSNDRPIILGVDGDGLPQLRLSDAELDFIDTENLLIGKFTAGPILVENAIDLKAQANNGSLDEVESLLLLTRSTITSTFPQGKLTVTNLGASAGGVITLNSANDVAVFAASADESVSGLGQDRIEFYDANDFSTGTVTVFGTLDGVTSTHNSVVLRAAGTVTVIATAPVTAFLDVTLEGEQSVVVTGSVTAGRDVVLTANQLDVTIDNAKVAAAFDAAVSAKGTFAMQMTNAAGPAPKLDAGGNVTITAAAIVLGPVPAGVTGAGIDPLVVTLTADTMSINLPIIASECVVLRTKTAGREIDLGGPDSPTKLGLTDAELSFIDAPILRVGKSDSGTITVTDTIDLKTQQPGFRVDTLHLRSGADVTADAAVAKALVSVNNLAVSAVNGLAFLPNANDVNVFASETRATAGFRDANNLQVGTLGVCLLPDVAGVTTAGSDVTIVAGQSVTLASAINAGAGTVRIDAGADAAQLATGTITAAALAVRAGNAIDLQAENAVQNLAAFAGTGAVFFRTRDALNVIEVAAGGVLFPAAVTGVITNSAAQGVTLNAGGRLSLQQPIFAGKVGDAGTGALRLTAVFGDVVQLDAGFARALALGVLSAGPVTMDSAGNRVDTFAAMTANDGAGVRFTSLVDPVALQLTIGAVAAAPLFGFDVVGVKTFNGDITLTANGLNIVQPIVAGPANCVTLRPLDPGRAILLGAEDPANALSLTGAELDRVFAGFLQIGRLDATPAGPITLPAPVALTTVTTLDLRTGGNIITAGAGRLTAARLAADATGNIQLGGANAIGLVALRAGGDVTNYRSDPLSIGVVDRCSDGPLSGISAGCVTLDTVTPGTTFDLGSDLTQDELNLIVANKLQIGAGNIREITVSAELVANNVPQLDLVAAGGSVLAAGGSLAVTTLSATADAAVLLGGRNQVDNLAAFAGTSVDFVNGRKLRVTAVTRCDGIAVNGVFAFTGSATLTADDVDLAQQVRAADCVVLQPRTDLTPIALAAADVSGALTLSDAELDFVAAKVLRIGSAAAGTVTVAHAINLVGNVPTLHLQTQKDVATAAGSLSVNNLAVQADGSVSLTGANDVDTFAAQAGVDVNFNDTDALTVATVALCGPDPVLSGVAAKAGSIDLKTGQLLTLDGDLTAAATVTLNPAAGGVTQVDTRKITADTLNLLGAGTFLLGKVADADANTPFFNDVNVLQAKVNGLINFRDAGNLTTQNVSTGGNALNLRVQNTFNHPTGGTIDLGAGAGSIVYAMTEATTDNYINGVSVLGDVKSAVPFSIFAGRFAVNDLNPVTNPSGSNTFAIRPTVGTNFAIFGSFPTLDDVRTDPGKFPGDSLSITLPAGATSVNFLAKAGFDASFGTVQFLDANRNVVTMIEFNSIERIANLSLQAFAVQTLDSLGQDAFALSVTGTLNGVPQLAQLQGSLPRATPFLAAPQLADSSQPFRTPSLAIGDVNADGFPDLIIGLGPNSGGPLVTVLDGSRIFTSSGEITNDLIITQFFAFDPEFNGGVTVAAADLDGDDRAEIIIGQGRGVESKTNGASQVRVVSVSGSAVDPISNQKLIVPRSGSAALFPAYPGFLGGVRVSAGDVNGDGTPDIVTGAGPGGGPHVKIFFVNANSTDLNMAGETGFYAYDPSFTGGIFVDAGDVDRDGKADIVTGAGLGGGPHIRAFDGGNILSRDFRPAVDFFDAQTFDINSPTVFPQLPVVFLDSPFTYATAGVGGVGFGLGDNDDTLDIFVGTGVGRAARARYYRLIRANGSFTVPFNNVPVDLPRPTIGNEPTSTFTGERTGVSVATSAAGVLG